MQNETSKQRVVVTGYGAVTSLGKNVNEIWNAIMDYKVGYSKYELSDKSITAKFFGKIPFELDISSFSRRILKNIPRFGRLGLIAANEALQMAFKNDISEIHKYYSPFSCGVIFGTGWGGDDVLSENSVSYNKDGYASTLTNILCMHSNCTAMIATNWKLRGYQNTPVSACATGGVAIGDAVEMIRSGRAEMILAGGGESLNNVFNIWSIDILNALCKEQNNIEIACCPFDKNRNGFVLSEGAAILCLEKYETALARGATILAEVTGYGNYSDAYDVTSPAPDCLGKYNAAKYALKQSNLELVDYINAHGTSTQLNDSNETKMFKMLFGDGAYSIPISSTKSYTGHLIAAAGALESILSIKSIETNIIPATIHLNNPDPDCDLDYVPNKHRYKENIQSVLNVNYGFGGSNTALIFKRFTQ
ncbi:3-oxoacyl-ACP synthase [Gilliamella sp. wkB7]|uniref:beta-ketoacyl-[acyl-carrier-protein] synthase family protein n=1 Tax=Gilliamella sp. wkB7 TaxID=3120264 RepID=UPI000810B21E|nr:beta-ketoacyl-[acyl-carrier-protein] synthase family protein [Gilliamella apicola]OCF91903.1 3-oxoacyl-ACP synthase [Gilliamella apicola]